MLKPPTFLPEMLDLVAWTFDPADSVTLSTHGTGNIHAAAVWLPANKVITTMGLYLGAAAVTPSHFQMGIYDKDFNLVASTPDSPNALLGTGYREVDLAEPYIVPESGLYYFADMIAAGTMPTVLTRTTVTQGNRSQFPNSDKYRAFNPGGTWTALPDPITPATSGAFNLVYAR